jgi:hypothetical protein
MGEVPPSVPATYFLANARYGSQEFSIDVSAGNGGTTRLYVDSNQTVLSVISAVANNSDDGNPYNGIVYASPFINNNSGDTGTNSASLVIDVYANPADSSFAGQITGTVTYVYCDMMEVSAPSYR